MKKIILILLCFTTSIFLIISSCSDDKSDVFYTIDPPFDNIKIEVKNADKMTENQEHAFVKEHFKI